MNAPRKISSSRASQEKESAPLSLDYEHLWRLCLKYWKWLAAAVVLGAVGGLIYALSQTPIYSAKAAILVDAKDANSGDGGDVGQHDYMSGDMIKTFEQLLQTKDLKEQVVKNEHLNENPDFLPDDLTPPVSVDTATGILSSEVTIRIRPLTRLIDISVEHRSPKMAQFLANRLANESIEQEMSQAKSGGSAAAEQVQKAVDVLLHKLTVSQSALKAYELSHNIVTAGGDNAENGSDTRLADLNKQYNEAVSELEVLKQRYGDQHPKLIQQKATVAQLQSEIDKVQQQAVSNSGDSGEYAALKSDVDSDRIQLDAAQKQLKEIQAKTEIDLPSISLREEATQPFVPVRPNKKNTVAAGALVGLACGLAFIVGVYFIDTSVRTVSQAESTLGLPVVAAVPILPDANVKSGLPTYSDPQSFTAEAFRGLRASLILHDRLNPLKTILMCSAVPGEGKSFCAANLAVAFAQAGLKTLLIDADLRLPTLHTYFNLPEHLQSNGFQDVLTGHADLVSALVTTPIPTLSVLLTSTPAESPAELLSNVRLHQLLDEAALIFDRIVIDSAPLNAVSDTMLIMQKADAIMLVVRAAQTPAGESKAALQKIANAGMKPLGLILNYLAPHTLKSYAYGYSYGQKPKEKNAK
jgi:polysaccharide biosynthesis transport protein